MARRLELCLSIAKVPRSPDQPPGLLNSASRFRKNAAIDRRTLVVGFSTSQVFGINRQLFHLSCCPRLCPYRTNSYGFYR